MILRYINFRYLSIYLSTGISVRIISLWNRLPVAVVQTDSLARFKSQLKTVDLSYALLGKL